MLEMITRGTILPLSQAQRVARARYLAGRAPLSTLDDFIRRDAATLAALGGYKQRMPDGTLQRIDLASAVAELDETAINCPDLYYHLAYPNGGIDPTAPDPAAREVHPGVVARLVDCSGGVAWAQGGDRFDVVLRIPGYTDHVGKIEGSWINTDSLYLAVQIPGSGFVALAEPEPGCVMTCHSGSPGHKLGHEAVVIAYHGGTWDPAKRACWEAIEAADCAFRTPAPTNSITSGRGWYGTSALLIRDERPARAGKPV